MMLLHATTRIGLSVFFAIAACALLESRCTMVKVTASSLRRHGYYTRSTDRANDSHNPSGAATFTPQGRFPYDL